jgi:hypothetical protein
MKRLIVLLLFLLTAAPVHAAGPINSDEPSSGRYVADLGFRADADGFSFRNYGKPPNVDLTAEDVRRLFGDQVCANTAKGRCTLTPAAKAWMTEVNEAMEGGHCDGLASLSLLMYLDRVKASGFGADRTHALSLPGNEKLQREIAYYWATQTTVPTITSIIRDRTPNQLLDLLIDSFQPGKAASDAYVLSIRKRQAPFAGHAIVPYAVEDRGGGIFWIMVYDNNWPNAARHVEVDRNANTWQYFASTNPSQATSLYEGDARTFNMRLKPTSPRLLQQACPFCAGSSYNLNELWLDGGGHLVLTDGQGRRTGIVGGQLLEEIPDVSYSFADSAESWEDDDDPVYYVPVGLAFTVTVDGTSLRQAEDVDVNLIGPGYDMSVEAIHLEPGQRDTLTLAPGPDGGSVSYETKYDESPSIVLGLETSGADYSFTVEGAQMKGGGTITVSLDGLKERLKIAVVGTKAPGSYYVEMTRTDDDDELTFSKDAVELAPGDSAYLDFGSWTTDRSTVPLGIDKGSKGSIDRTVQLTED